MRSHRIASTGPWLGFGLFILYALFNPMPLLAAGEDCSNGAPSPCYEDIKISNCTVCHSIRVLSGNRNGTDRQITASSGSIRHETAPRRDDWTATVEAMSAKGFAMDTESISGYLNTNYCTSCNGPILGSPAATAIGGTTATIEWSTSSNGFEDEPSDTVLYYGTDKADVLLGPGCVSCQMVSAAAPVAHHIVNLTGLTGSTRYYVVNQSTSSLGTARSSYAVTFRTRPDCPTGGGDACFVPILPQILLSNNPSSNSGDSPRLVSIDSDNDTEIASIPVSNAPGELIAHPGGIVAYLTEGKDLSIIGLADDARINVLTAVGDLFNHLAVSADGDRLYLLYRKSTGMATLEIKVYDTSSPDSPLLLTTISNPIFNGCYGPLGLAVRPDGSKLYLVCRPISSGLPDRFYTVDTTTNIPGQTATFGRDASNYLFINALAVTPDGSRVYVARTNNSGSTVEYFDGTTGAHSGTIPLPSNALPRAGVITPDGAKLYVVDQRLGTHVISTITNSLVLTFPQTKSRGMDIAMSTDGARVYTTLLGNVFVLDTASNNWVSTITGDFTNAQQITFSPGAPQ